MFQGAKRLETHVQITPVTRGVLGANDVSKERYVCETTVHRHNDYSLSGRKEIDLGWWTGSTLGSIG